MTPYYHDENSGITIYHGDNVTVMSGLPDGSIDLVVTSPPYDNLRTYGGHSWDFPGVAANLTRLLKPGGVIVWIVADATIDGSETGTSMRQALHFKDVCGLRLHDTMIYEKYQISFPESVRYYQAWEYAFVFSKGSPIAFNPITLPNQRAGEKNYSTKRSREGVLSMDSGYINGKVAPDRSVKRNVWKYSTGTNSCEESFAIGHPAIFPEALARDHILSWSNPGDTVLDPFSGSGTTMKMAKENGRMGIGIEINKPYCDIAVDRLRQGVLFGVGVSA